MSEKEHDIYGEDFWEDYWDAIEASPASRSRLEARHKERLAKYDKAAKESEAFLRACTLVLSLTAMTGGALLLLEKLVSEKLGK